MSDRPTPTPEDRAERVNRRFHGQGYPIYGSALTELRAAQNDALEQAAEVVDLSTRQLEQAINNDEFVSVSVVAKATLNELRKLAAAIRALKHPEEPSDAED